MANLSPAGDVLEILADEGVGVIGQTLFDNREPDAGDELLVTVYDTSATQSPEPKFLRDYPSVQIRVRGTVFGYQGAREKANTIKNKLLGRPPTVVGLVTYCGFWMVDDIIPLGYDTRDRPILVLNFRLVAERESGGFRQPL